MTSQRDIAKRWRPWQFSLLLIMLGAACFLGGWTANEWKRQHELERAQQEMEVEAREDMEAIVQLLTEHSLVSDD